MRNEMGIIELLCALDIIEANFGWVIFICLNTEAKSMMLSALNKELQQTERYK